MKKWSELHDLDRYVIFSIAVVLIYSVAEFITSTITGVEKSTLTLAIYGFFAGEVTVAGLIKIFKIKDNGEKLEFYKDE